MPVDYNVRDVFSLFTGRCGHKWVGTWCHEECPTCGDYDREHVIAEEPIAVNFTHRGTLDKVQRRISRAIRENRRKKRKTAAIISLTDHRPQPDALTTDR
jgi:hypothetical protein